MGEACKEAGSPVPGAGSEKLGAQASGWGSRKPPLKWTEQYCGDRWGI